MFLDVVGQEAPLLVLEAGPEVVELSDGELLGLQDDLGPVGVNV